MLRGLPASFKYTRCCSDMQSKYPKANVLLMILELPVQTWCKYPVLIVCTVDHGPMFPAASGRLLTAPRPCLVTILTLPASQSRYGLASAAPVLTPTVFVCSTASHVRLCAAAAGHHTCVLASVPAPPPGAPPARAGHEAIPITNV